MSYQTKTLDKVYTEMKALGFRLGTANEGQNLAGCQTCGEDDFSPNIEAFEISGQILCDECTQEVFEENEQFGAGA